ncbi:MAG: DUF547 domain-containing protein [Acidobacteria bacterium]|nr:DUF547 domain-containing protein [Acidobacteriota bacterium]NIM63716.1 DUF547 domain-containing protein [Acidobacteriota bacterium]NIO60101.1 DUF547 domain-containing protein [Acidobacteriota bacterium]NIQ31172.1 DUF547 domain-containing protein [Acidobacteriota bacterium]NIQ86301.1 DUF547 domain-containing protein [Acidobacteriota bacterium]
MKRSLLITPLLLASLGTAASETLDRYDDLLARYVVGGDVRYDAWRANMTDRDALAEIIVAFESSAPSSLQPNDRYALYINLYNAKTLQIVLDGDPEHSIKELSRARFGYGIFYKKLINFDGGFVSLNSLEKRLREESGDPRVHFAVNCASRSCPVLLDEAYRGDRLDEQLERQSFSFLERDDALRLEDRGFGAPVVRLSKIFDWYAKDFGGTRGVRRFVQAYAPQPIRERIADGGFRVAHMEYDWRLNRAD